MTEVHTKMAYKDRDGSRFYRHEQNVRHSDKTKKMKHQTKSSGKSDEVELSDI